MTAMTELFYRDPYAREFTSRVTSCEEGERGFEIMLEDTAFYPEGGGQPADQIRSHSRRSALPFYQIPAHHMPPVHWSPFIGIRIILIKKMILAFIIRKTIWIINPARSACYVIRRSFLRADLADPFFLIFSGLF